MTAVDICVRKRYRVEKQLYDGRYHTYSGTNTVTEEEVVVQLEPIVVDHPQLEHETRVREALAGGVGIPFLHWSGVDGENNAAVSDLLGPSLEDMFKLCNRKFSLKTVFLVAVQLISRIEYCHSKSFIHRDIRPENFYLGRGKLQDRVHISNFGLAKKYTFPEDGHIPYTENKTFVGSARYASLNGHHGIENSRRDDMESLGYVMLYFCRGSLPWQGLHASTREEKWMRIMEKKRDTPTEVLCRGLPDDFLAYLNCTRSLRFDEKPNYDYLRDIFRNGFHRESFQFDYVFDWTAYPAASKGLAPPVFVPYRGSDILAQPEIKPLSVEMVVNEVKCIYAGLAETEKECIKLVEQQSRSTENLSDNEWRTLTARHRTLLCQHHDFFRASHHPSSSPPLRRLATKYNLPGRMWNHGMYNFLELLRGKLPSSRDHILAFLRLVDAITASLMETIPDFEELWTECLGDLARYWMSVSDTELDLNVWSGVAKFWYENAAGKSPDSGRIQHHLAITMKPNIVQELFYFSKALVSVVPYELARESMMTRVLDVSSSAVKQPLGVERAFVKACSLLFTRGSIPLFDKTIGVFISGIDSYANREKDLFQMQGSRMACILCAALLDFGHPKAPLYKALLARDDQNKPLCAASRSAVRAGQLLQEDPKINSSTPQECWGRMQHTLYPILRLSEPANITEDTLFSSSEETLTRACLSFRRTISVLFKRAHDRHVLPFAHVILTFLKCISEVHGMLIDIEGLIPWAVIAKFLNTVERSSAVRFESVGFPYRGNDSTLPLPEDFILRGFAWARHCFPTEFFEDQFLGGYERMLELPSEDAYRVERCLWAGCQLALANRCLKYDTKTQQFSITTFAQSLEDDFMTLLLTSPTWSIASDFDMNTAVSSKPLLCVKSIIKEEQRENGKKEGGEEGEEEEEEEEERGGEREPWTIISAIRPQ